MLHTGAAWNGEDKDTGGPDAGHSAGQQQCDTADAAFRANPCLR